MSSLRNSLHRRNHKERGQLAHRERLGVLEKHKDYVLRARDYHSKQDRLTRLRQKAADRNKDEFYFGMNREKTKGGVHIKDRGNEALPVDVVKVLKSQDESYIRTARTVNAKKIEKLRGQLSALADLVKADPFNDTAEDTLEEDELEILREAGLIARPTGKKGRKSKSKAKHVVFTEEGEDRTYAPPSSTNAVDDDAMDEDIAEDPETLGWKVVKAPSTARSIKGKEKATVEEIAAFEHERKEASVEQRQRLLKELAARLHRDKLLRYTGRELEMQKALMGKGGSRKIRGVEKVTDDGDDDERDSDDDRPRRQVDEKLWKPRVYKWRMERKR